ncbi:hypothetical protein ANN_07863 [Periplaneta americana]|uniref:Uncharacterized protein n=1 Tax=Periplaneta americana TaxID=6978 RepID=A0ABQ8SZT3_PERAM|nr:hypothetical protein ANN_07863 [Periplaneta americana]
MSPGFSTESYPAFTQIGLRENYGKILNQFLRFSNTVVLDMSSFANRRRNVLPVRKRNFSMRSVHLLLVYPCFINIPFYIIIVSNVFKASRRSCVVQDVMTWISDKSHYKEIKCCLEMSVTIWNECPPSIVINLDRNQDGDVHCNKLEIPLSVLTSVGGGKTLQFNKLRKEWNEKAMQEAVKQVREKTWETNSKVLAIVKRE